MGQACLHGRHAATERNQRIATGRRATGCRATGGRNRQVTPVELFVASPAKAGPKRATRLPTDRGACFSTPLCHSAVLGFAACALAIGAVVHVDRRVDERTECNSWKERATLENGNSCVMTSPEKTRRPQKSELLR